MTFDKKIIRSLFTIVFIDQTYLTLTFPLITLIFFDEQSRLFAADTSYATRSIWYGFCVALPNSINIFFAPLLSSLSDKYGRCKIIFIEIFSAFIFTLLVALGVTYGALTLVFTGFLIKGAFARINPTALAMVGDVIPPHKKISYMSSLQFAISLGALLGPFLGGYLAFKFFFSEVNFAFPFFVAASLALANLSLAKYLLHETRVVTHTSVTQFNFAAFKEIFMHPSILRISTLLLLIQLSWSLYYQFIPPALKIIYHYDSHQLGLFIGMIAFWLALTTGLGLKILLRYFSVARLLNLSLYLILIGLFITYLATLKYLPEYYIWLGAAPIASGDVMAYSCLTALYSNSLESAQQGKVMGVALFIVATIWSITGFLGGFLLSVSPLFPLLIAPFGVLMAFFFLRSQNGRKLVLATGV